MTTRGTDNTIKLQEIKRYIECHGFPAWRSGCREIAFASPSFSVPVSMSGAGKYVLENGYDITRVATFAEARRELGH